MLRLLAVCLQGLQEHHCLVFALEYGMPWPAAGKHCQPLTRNVPDLRAKYAACAVLQDAVLKPRTRQAALCH